MGAWGALRRFMNSESASAPVEQRAITSVPWNVGDDLYAGPATLSGERALGLIPVYAAIGLLARTISSTPLHSYRRLDDTQRERISPPQLIDRLVRAGQLQPWLHRAVVSMATRGNAVGLVTERDGYGFPVAIEWLHPDHVSVDDSALYGRGSYRLPVWRFNGLEVDRRDIVHIPFFAMPGKVWGLSPLSAAASMISTGLSAQDYTQTWFNNGGVPPGTFRNTAREIDSTQAELVKQRLMAAIRRKQPLVYGNDWEFEPIAITPAEANFVAVSKLTATQIAAIFDVPPERIGGETGGSLSYSSPEQASLHLVTFSLRNWYELFEHVFSSLLPERQYLKFAIDSLYRADIATRYSVYSTGIELGLLSIDECRAWEDLPPLPNGQGAKYRVPADPTTGGVSAGMELPAPKGARLPSTSDDQARPATDTGNGSRQAIPALADRIRAAQEWTGER